jgi:signal transduction histidine kinase
MSIRLRFTLLYSVILAAVLIFFSVGLYSTQAKSSYDGLQMDLIHSIERLESSIGRTNNQVAEPPNSSNEPIPPEIPSVITQPAPANQNPNPVPFAMFSDAPAFKDFPEREIARILDSDGNLIASPFGRAEDALPLSDETLMIVKKVGESWDTAIYQDQRMLIYSKLVERDDQQSFIIQAAKPLTERDRTLQSLAVTLVGASMLTLTVAFGIGWVLSGFTFRPIHRMTKAVHEIGKERDFTRRLEYTGPQDELGQLATTFNEMLNQLDSAYQQVAHSLEMQRNFVADVSHELRTPLTTLRGNLGLLTRKPPISKDEQSDILCDMVDESDRLIRLVNDLLILARADAGRSLAREVVDIKPLLEETCRQAKQLDEKRNINLLAEAPLVLGDRDAIKQVLLIAMDNALKHSSGDVEIRAYQKDGKALIEVNDHGIGIKPDKLTHIFERFYRGGESNEIHGFGLGLAIAKNLVEAQQGEINMESELGIGSKLMIRFPAL